MRELAELTAQLDARTDLDSADVAAAAELLASPTQSDDDKGRFLTAFAKKGETAAEVAAFATEFRQRAINPGVEAWAPRAIDIVGTGGDHAGGFNISTMVVFTLAVAGVPVMKHGNRGVTSKCGSADLLAALGVNLQAPPEKLRASLGELGFAFFFAPAFHPAFKHIVPVRKTLAAQGQRTVFNILGPLTNPGRPAHLLLGSFSQQWVQRLAQAMDGLGVEAGLVAHGILGADRGIDELTTATPNRVRGAGRMRELDTTWLPGDHGFRQTDFSDLLGGDLTTNLAIVEAVLAGRGPVGLVDTIVFNTATALWLCGRTASVSEGAGWSRECLLGGGVKARIAAAREFYRS